MMMRKEKGVLFFRLKQFFFSKYHSISKSLNVYEIAIYVCLIFFYSSAIINFGRAIHFDEIFPMYFSTQNEFSRYFEGILKKYDNRNSVQ